MRPTRPTLPIAIITLPLALTALAPTTAEAQVFARASDNATVQPGGPRSGTNGKNFFNVEGSNYGANSSFGVLDFTAASFGISGTVTSVNSLNLLLRDAPAAFSTSGGLNFYLASNTTASIQPGGGLTYNTANGVEGVGSQLGTLYLLGSGSYTKGVTGAGGTTGLAYNYALSLPAGAATTQFINALNNAGTLRLVVTPTNAATAATFGGFSSTTAGLTDSPRLSFNAVTGIAPATAPEPTSLALIATAGLGVFAIARRRNRA
jgi:hypothetical protein